VCVHQNYGGHRELSPTKFGVGEAGVIDGAQGVSGDKEDGDAQGCGQIGAGVSGREGGEHATGGFDNKKVPKGGNVPE
jgi:hypothetical protein